MRKVYNFFGGRKLFFALLLLSTAIVFVAVDKAEFPDFSQFIMWVFGIYSVGNVGSKAFSDKPITNQ